MNARKAVCPSGGSGVTRRRRQSAGWLGGQRIAAHRALGVRCCPHSQLGPELPRSSERAFGSGCGGRRWPACLSQRAVRQSRSYWVKRQQHPPHTCPTTAATALAAAATALVQGRFHRAPCPWPSCRMTCSSNCLHNSALWSGENGMICAIRAVQRCQHPSPPPANGMGGSARPCLAHSSHLCCCSLQAPRAAAGVPALPAAGVQPSAAAHS